MCSVRRETVVVGGKGQEEELRQTETQRVQDERGQQMVVLGGKGWEGEAKSDHLGAGAIRHNRIW